MPTILERMGIASTAVVLMHCHLARATAPTQGLLEQQLAERDAVATHTAASMTRYRWLAGIALPCKGDEIGRSATQAIIEQYAGPNFHVRLNIFDSNSSCLVPHPYVIVSYVPGYMTIFWKRVLLPDLTRKYDRIFILDNDIKLSPMLGFSLAAVDRWFALTSTMVLQPSVIGANRAKRAGTGVRAHSTFTADCVAYQVNAVERLHVSRPEAYEVLWDILHSIPDERLSTDTGLMSLWLSLVCERFPGRPSGVIVQSIAAVHLDTHTIRKAGLDPFYNHPSQKKVNVLFLMYEHPVYAQYVNGSAKMRINQRCGRSVSTLDDLGLPSKGSKRPTRPMANTVKGSTNEPIRCWSSEQTDSRTLAPRSVHRYGTFDLPYSDSLT